MSNQISVLLHTSEYRGDHSADVVKAYEIKEGETVEELVERLIAEQSSWAYTDHIELRRINPSNANHTLLNPQ